MCVGDAAREQRHRVNAVADDWRVAVTFTDATSARTVVQAVRRRQVGDEVHGRLEDSVVVSADGPHLFVYAATEDAARAADSVVREVVAQRQLYSARKAWSKKR